MAYATGNPPTKKELKARVAAYNEGSGPEVEVFSPGPFGAKQNGREYIEGPHYPKPHSWYAQVDVVDGVIVKVVG